LGVRLAEPIEVREQSVTVPFRQLDAAFSRAETAGAVEPGEIAIEATVDVTFRLDTGSSAGGGD
jgi:uncharacterized protein YggE